LRLKSAGKAKRHALWSKEQFLLDLRRFRVIKKVCQIYADEVSGWRAYHTDQWQWRKEDPEFDETVKAILKDNGVDHSNSGRPRKDGGDKSWQDSFCEALIKHDWNFLKASEVTPYTPRQLMEFQDPACSSYDEEFAKMVEAAELVIASRARQIIVGDGLDPESYKDFETAKITQTKLWAALKAQERLEKKYGRRHLEISGSVDHRHQHRMLPVNERFALLQEDRKRFLEARRKEVLRINTGEENGSRILEYSDEEMLEAEVVEDDAD